MGKIKKNKVASAPRDRVNRETKAENKKEKPKVKLLIEKFIYRNQPATTYNIEQVKIKRIF